MIARVLRGREQGEHGYVDGAFGISYLMSVEPMAWAPFFDLWLEASWLAQDASAYRQVADELDELAVEAAFADGWIFGVVVR